MRKLRILERLEMVGGVSQRAIICELFYDNQFKRKIQEGWRVIE